MTARPWSAATVRLRELFESQWSLLDRRAAGAASGGPVSGGRGSGGAVSHDPGHDRSVITAKAVITAKLEIDTPHGALRLGLDGDGLRHLLVPIGPAAGVEDDVRSAGVRLTTRTLSHDDGLPVRYADIACLRRDLAGTFTGLVADLAGLILAEPDQAPSLIVRTLHAWRLLLAGASTSWTVPRLAGLFAELRVLEALLDVNPQAVRAWLGPLGCPQDFRGAHHAIEVKAGVAAEGRVVHVHGVDQLETPTGGTLTLAWSRVTESTAPGARSVPDLLAACRERIDDLGAFETRLTALGLPGGDGSTIDRVRFLTAEQRWYDVSGDFPRVVPGSFVGGAAPAGVRGVEYRIDLNTVAHTAEPERVLKRLGADL
ncbi:PD-(D/E)XK motif protein [Streptomyces sp. NPDC102278]|uniref:PD-(D/E)XK motif protein n=1 Tax=Streptomyces sp. NPDC102278 TaxID=3366152 RepID=UPI0038061CBD